MDDMKARFNKGYGYVVAEPALNPEDGRMGGTFGWVWYGDRAMLPTAHEKMSRPKYDVNGWILNDYVTDMQWSQSKDKLTEARFGETFLGDPDAIMEWKEFDHPGRRSTALVPLLETGLLFHPTNPQERKPLALPEGITHAASVRLYGHHSINDHVSSVPGVTPDKNMSPQPSLKSILKKAKAEDESYTPEKRKNKTWMYVLLGLVIAVMLVWLLYTFVWKPRQQQQIEFE
jgi:hypothetical protein